MYSSWSFWKYWRFHIGYNEKFVLVFLLMTALCNYYLKHFRTLLYFHSHSCSRKNFNSLYRFLCNSPRISFLTCCLLFHGHICKDGEVGPRKPNTIKCNRSVNCFVFFPWHFWVSFRCILRTHILTLHISFQVLALVLLSENFGLYVSAPQLESHSVF